jgi:hypothetical protein
MEAPRRKVYRSKRLVLALCGSFAVLSLSAFQYGDRNGLNGLPFAQVQPLVSDLARAQSMAQQGNIDLFSGQAVPGEAVNLYGELTDSNCYLGRHAHGYDHAFCAKLCAAAGSPLLFISDQGGDVYVVLTPRDAIPFPANILDHIGVPGILIKGRVRDADGVRALMVERLEPRP